VVVVRRQFRRAEMIRYRRHTYRTTQRSTSSEENPRPDKARTQ
jgi:hypothetical protein